MVQLTHCVRFCRSSSLCNSSNSNNLPAKAFVPLPFQSPTRNPEYCRPIREYKRLAKRNGNLDYLVLQLRGGQGGDGRISHTHDFSRGAGDPAPNGGRGGDGGNVYVMVDAGKTNLRGIAHRLIAGRGGDGWGDYRRGLNGNDVVIKVPLGTVLRQKSRVVTPLLSEDEIETSSEDEKIALIRARLYVKGPGVPPNEPWPSTPAERNNSTIHGLLPPPPPPIYLDLKDVTEQPILIARGGKGGEGNGNFQNENGLKRFARRGEIPDRIELEFELRLMADVGLIGTPNVGKSTIHQALTASNPTIRNYNFTTLNPHLGVCKILGDGTISSAPSYTKPIIETPSVSRYEPAIIKSKPAPTSHIEADETIRFTICDNPGLIQDAHKNKGLGHHFLMAVSRSPILALVLDFSLPLSALVDSAKMILRELDEFEPELRLKQRVKVVLCNKADLVQEQDGLDKQDALEALIQQEFEDANEMRIELASAKRGLNMKNIGHVFASLVLDWREMEAARKEMEEEWLYADREEEEIELQRITS